MNTLLKAIQRPILLILLLGGIAGSAYGVWSIYYTPPTWIEQKQQISRNIDDYPDFITAKGEAISPHRRMAVDKARLKAISNLMRSVNVSKEGINVVTQKTGSGQLVEKRYNGSMNDFKQLDAYVEEVNNDEYKAYVLIGLKKTKQ